MEFYKDITKAITQITTLSILTKVVENCEKTNDMLKAKFKITQSGQIKAQFQKRTQNGGSTFKPQWQNNNTPKNNQQFANKNGPKNNFKPNNNNKNSSNPVNQNRFKNSQKQPKYDNSGQKCHRCGHLSHKIANCRATWHKNGDILPSLSKKGGNPDPSIKQIDELGFYYDFGDICEMHEITSDNILGQFPKSMLEQSNVLQNFTSDPLTHLIFGATFYSYATDEQLQFIDLSFPSNLWI